jgi:hypothetical protein
VAYIDNGHMKFASQRDPEAVNFGAICLCNQHYMSDLENNL